MSYGDYGDARECPACADKRLILRREAKKNEQRMRAGKPPVMREIQRQKQLIADCARLGHHDVQAGPDARWHSTA